MTDDRDAKARELVAAIEDKIGFVPNLLRSMEPSSVATETYLGGQAAMGAARLTPAEQHIAEVTISAANGCRYCQSAHATVAQRLGVSPEDTAAVREGGVPADEDLERVVRATRLLMDKRGWLDAEDLQTLEAEGIDRERVYEIITLIGLKTISNWINHIAGTTLDEQFGG